MIGDDPKEAIPLVYFGMGTRQNALFTLTSVLTDSPNPVVVLDEPEIGLEPYRQRALVWRLRSITGTQVKPSSRPIRVTSCTLESAEVWRLDRGRSPASLRAPLESLKKRAPDALISALPVIAEGDTEAGFLEVILGAKARDAGHRTKPHLESESFAAAAPSNPSGAQAPWRWVQVESSLTRRLSTLDFGSR